MVERAIREELSIQNEFEAGLALGQVEDGSQYVVAGGTDRFSLDELQETILNNKTEVITAPENPDYPDYEFYFLLYERFKEEKCPDTMPESMGFIYDTSSNKCIYTFPNSFFTPSEVKEDDKIVKYNGFELSYTSNEETCSVSGSETKQALVYKLDAICVPENQTTSDDGKLQFDKKIDDCTF